MDILLTNDDGITAPGILAMREALLRSGHRVCVVAPDGERSASSQAITIKRPLHAANVKLGEDAAYAVDGTPADCSKLGLLRFFPKADFVVSGINNGANVGKDTLYSGTVAAAMEAAMLGFPALAVSVDFSREPEYGFAAKLAVRMLAYLGENPMPKGTMCSLNLPALSGGGLPKGIRFAHLDDGSVLSDYEECHRRREGSWYFAGLREKYEADEGSDRALLNEGYAAVTYLHWSLEAPAPRDTLFEL